jgi:DNA polymerase-3 subunit delta'
VPLKNVCGQDRAVRMLTGMILRGRIASTYLFGGPAGTGKRFTAMQFIKALNCEAAPAVSGEMSSGLFELGGSGDGGDACGVCNSCRKVDSLMHPDLRVVRPEEGMIRIEDIRELEEFLSFTPLEGRWKAVVVEDADMMNLNAANAFLKTLEEPPAHSVIILLAVREDALPDTVRSRAMRIGFVPLSGAAVTTIADRLGLKIPTGRPVLSIGSIGSAVGGEVLEGRNRALAVFKTMIVGGSGTSAWKDREDMEEWFEAAFVLLRDMAAIKIGSAAPGINGSATPRVNGRATPGIDDGSACLPINHDIADDLANICKAVDLKVIIECYEKLLGIGSRFIYNPGEKIVANYVGQLVGNSFGRR